jgi:hypothetical protein
MAEFISVSFLKSSWLKKNTMYQYFIILFLIPFSTVIAQKSDSIKLYYEYRYKAEINIIDSNFESAVSNYEESTKYLSPFGSDSYNACLCAIECNKLDKAIFFASKLIEKGIPIDFFDKSDLFKKLINHESWRKYLKSSPSSTYNKTIHKKLDS